MRKLIGLFCLLLLLAHQAHAQPTTILTATPATRAAITIPTAAVLTAETAPVPILAAQPGYVYVVVWAEITLAYNSATYSSTACGLYYHGTTQLATGANVNATVQATASAIGIAPGVIANNVANANAVGLGIDFACTSSNPTTGNSPLKIVIEYVAVPI